MRARLRVHKRQDILDGLRRKLRQGLAILGAGAGTGLSARSEEDGGVDLMIVYNSGRFRMAGRGSTAGLMPYGNANQIVKEMAAEILPVVKHTPVLAGVCATDPFMIPEHLLRELRSLGFAGIQNFPTIGLLEGELRQALEETDMGFDKEVDCIALAHEMDLLTTPYVFNAKEAKLMTAAGADIIVAHMGATCGGNVGVKTTRTVSDCVPAVQAIVQASRAVRDDVIVLCHGGPLAEPDQAQYMLDHIDGLGGFYGASAIERTPAESAIAQQVRRFAELRVKAS